MNNIVRAWKDEGYRQSLSAKEQAMLPANPAGEVELKDAELEAIFGAEDEVNREEITGTVTVGLPIAVSVPPVAAIPPGSQNNLLQCRANASKFGQ